MDAAGVLGSCRFVRRRRVGVVGRLLVVTGLVVLSGFDVVGGSFDRKG
jgi:hypothetical protein